MTALLCFRTDESHINSIDIRQSKTFFALWNEGIKSIYFLSILLVTANNTFYFYGQNTSIIVIRSNNIIVALVSEETLLSPDDPLYVYYNESDNKNYFLILRLCLHLICIFKQIYISSQRNTKVKTITQFFPQN